MSDVRSGDEALPWLEGVEDDLRFETRGEK